MSAEFHELSVIDLVAGYRARDFSPVEVVTALLERIEREEPETRAFVTVTADIALRQARDAERAHARGSDRPLLGIPVSLKDLIDVRGVPTTASSRVLADNVPARDAAVWARLRRAGAILVGKTNTHEFAYGGTTEPTRNPWNRDRMVGGSSGGSAAAVAAGMCPASIGTDAAVSVRIPAALCGVVGLKPTAGLVPRTGILPLSPTLDHVGPIARSPRDAALLMDAMVGYDAGDPGSLRRRRPTTYVPRGGELAGVRVGVVDHGSPLTLGVRHVVEGFMRLLEDAGAELTPVSIGGLDEATSACFTILAVEAADYHEDWLASRADDYTPYVRDRIREGFDIPAVEYRRALATCARVRERCDDALAEIDVLVLPAMPFPAPEAYVETVSIDGVDLGRDYALCRNTAFANDGGHPALTLHAGFEDGLPIGVQLVAARFADARLLEVADAVAERVEGALVSEHAKGA